MRKLTIILAILPIFAHSGEQNGFYIHRELAYSRGSQALTANQYQHTSAEANASSKAVSASSANSTNSVKGGDVNVDSDVAASSTVTGSSNTTAQCRYYDSVSGSILIGGFTKTTMLRDLVCTLGEPLNPEQKIALCLESSDYRKVRNLLKEPCQ